MDRTAVVREFTASADTQFGGASGPFREARLVAIILDDMGTSAPPCLHGERTGAGRQTPACSGLRQFRGNTAAVRGCAASHGGDRRALRGQIAGFVCDGQSAQASIVDPNCDSGFFKDKLSGCSACWRAKRTRNAQSARCDERSATTRRKSR
jgi:hypothetical protein